MWEYSALKSTPIQKKKKTCKRTLNFPTRRKSPSNYSNSRLTSLHAPVWTLVPWPSTLKPGDISKTPRLLPVESFWWLPKSQLLGIPESPCLSPGTSSCCIHLKSICKASSGFLNCVIIFLRNLQKLSSAKRTLFCLLMNNHHGASFQSAQPSHLWVTFGSPMVPSDCPQIHHLP